jgi:hypothetical protein
MDGKIKQHVCIKFYLKLSKSATETLEMLREAFGKHSLSQTAVFEWHSRFKASQVSAEDDECSERPSTSKTTEKCLTSKGNRKRYSTALRKMTSMVLLKRGKNDGIAVYVPKKTILKEMADKIE